MRETHIFDVDHTLVRTSTGTCFIKTALRKRHIHLFSLIQVPFYMIQYKRTKLDDTILDKELHVLKGMDRDLLFSLGKESFEKHVKKNIFAEAQQLITILKENGSRIILSTSSFDFLIIPVAEYFGLENIICSSMEYKDNKCTGKIAGKPAFGSFKMKKTLQFLEDRDINTQDCTFYSDSYYDLPLFMEIKNKKVINPDKKLRFHAKSKNWDIIKYKDCIK